MDRDYEMVNKYLNRVNEYINMGNKLPEYIYNELIDIKNTLENDSISIENRKLKCVLLDNLFSMISALDENDDKKRRR